MAPISNPPKLGKVQRPCPENQRATVRYRCPPATPGRIYRSEDLEFQRAWLQDLSMTGVGLLMAKPLERDIFVTIQIKSPNSKRTHQLNAHVVHSTQQASGDWLIGCQFLEPLVHEDLEDLL